MKKYIFILTAVAVFTSVFVGTYLYGQSALNLQQLTPTVSAASVDYFLKMDGIEGEGHMGEIMLESWSWGETNSGTGKVSMQDFHFTMKTSKASPNLMLAVASGQHFPNAILTARKTVDNQMQEYLTIKLTDVMISSYQIGGSSGAVPTDQVS